MKELKETVINALLSTDIKDISRQKYEKISGYSTKFQIKNIIVVYISEIRAFAGISLDNLYKKKYDKYFINKPIDYIFLRNEKPRVRTRVYLYNIDDFIQDYPHSAIEFFMEEERIKYDDYNGDKHILHYALEYLKYPILEQLMKAGFSKIIADYFAGSSYSEWKLEDIFNVDGTNISEISGLKEYQWRIIKDKVFDIKTYLKLKDLLLKHNFSKENLLRLTDILADTNADGFSNSSRYCEYLKEILDEEYRGKKLYKVSSLMKYLDRLYLEQGYQLNRMKMLRVLRDYNQMCINLDLYPDTRPSNLSYAHDAIMNQYNQVIDEEKNKKYEKAFRERYKILKNLEYQDERLKVIVPRKAKDIIAEGRNNHNCVGTYVERHAHGDTNILFIRMLSNLNKSYITVELDRKLQKVVQAYYGHNQPINNTDKKFITDWLKNVNKGRLG